jgi:hypothetical protein
MAIISAPDIAKPVRNVETRFVIGRHMAKLLRLGKLVLLNPIK